MPVKIRLQRHGKKGQPFYHIVIADGRAPRDGKFIEKIGTYNPITQPASIDVEVDKAVKWLRNGAQPTDTVKAILSYTGVLYKKHLLIGVEKGAFDEAEAERRFNVWKAEKEDRIHKAKSNIEEKKRNARKEAMASEAKVNEERAQEILKRKAAELEAKAKEARKAAGEEEATEETPAEETTGEE
ncbi:MAG: 30S ribosomal protein S16 [Bacteroidales bacterium]|nr:30S ribosomal protein S16 [Bacteroidales bacterium]